MTLRDDAGLKDARGHADTTGAGSGQHPGAAIPPAEQARNRYVIGIFARSSDAYGAVGRLAQEPCDVLVVLDDPKTHAPAQNAAANGRVIVHHVDTSDALTANLAAALEGPGPFAALRSGAREKIGAAPSPGTHRLFRNLVHHLAAGAAVAIVHAPDPERQLLISRALLEAKCDILLTHEVVRTAAERESGEPAAHAATSCESCTSPSCCRIDRTDGTAHKA